jgi:hypothetical protein
MIRMEKEEGWYLGVGIKKGNLFYLHNIHDLNVTMSHLACNLLKLYFNDRLIITVKPVTYFIKIGFNFFLCNVCCYKGQFSL